MQSEEFIAKNSFQRRPLLWVGYEPYERAIGADVKPVMGSLEFTDVLALSFEPRASCY